MSKTCTVCQALKPLDDYPLERRNRDGRAGMCRDCYRVKWAGRSKIRRKTEAERARDRARERQRRAADPEVIRAAQRTSYRRNSVDAIARARRWREANPDRRRIAARIDARRRRLGRDPLAIAYADILRHDPCAYCGAATEDIDHIDAAANGGANVAGNLTAACRDCNRRKSTAPLLTFLLRQDRR